jgi:serine/threonine-protein phosphatase PP1 catalytic subunit
MLFFLSILFFLGLLCDLLWSDPDENTHDWESNERGISLTFSKKNLRDFLKKNEMDLIVRGHQVYDKII